MKKLLSIFISTALVVSGYAQTRNVLVGTNNAVVQPTNFWSADASNARAGLGLGTAATNPASAFQPTSTVLSNLSASNAAGLTNIAASSIVGTVAIASNITGTAPLATNVTGIVSLANGGTAGTNALSARASLGATTVGANLFTLVDPNDTRFIRLNANNTVSALSATDMRTALSVGTNAGTVTSVGMTVPNIFSLSTSTITSSGTFGLTLANQSSRQAFLVPNGGGTPAFRGIESDDLPSLAISKITGLQTAIDGKLATNGTAPLAVNVTGTVAVANGGTGGTTAETARTGLGATTVGSGLFTLLNPSAVRFIRLNADNTVSSLSDSDFRTAIGLGTAATNPATAFQASSANLTNLAANNGANLTNISISGVVGTVALASNVTGTIAISNGGSGATTAGGARTNLGLGASNNVEFNSVTTELLNYGTNFLISLANQELYDGGVAVLSWSTNSIELNAPIVIGSSSAISVTRTNLGLPWIGLTNTNASTFRSALEIGTTNTLTIAGVVAQNLTVTAGGGIILQSTLTNAASFRTNIGLPWGGLTNTNSATFQTALFGTNTNPVLVNTNGEVVSPTNFWQAAPITTTFIESQPVTNFTTNITPTRFLHIHSLATNIVNVTNTVVLPTNTLTFEGDVAIVVHKGPTNSMTRVQRAGSTNNLITLTRLDEAVQFVYYNDVWQFDHNVAFVEPIYFSGTNAAANAAASRTNLGLGATNNPLFNSVVVGGPSAFNNNPSASFIAGDTGSGDEVHYGINGITWYSQNDAQNNIDIINASFNNSGAWTFNGAIYFGNTTNAATTRTNLGLGQTNNVTFSNVTASGTLTATSTVTAKTNLVVEGFVDFTTNHTNATPVTPNTPAIWLQIRVGTNVFYLPAHQ